MSTAKIRETKLLFGVGLSRIKFTGFSPPFHSSALHTRNTVGLAPKCQLSGGLLYASALGVTVESQSLRPPVSGPWHKNASAKSRNLV